MAGLTQAWGETNFDYAVKTVRALVIADDPQRAAPAIQAMRDAGCVVQPPVSLAQAVQDRDAFDGIHLLWVEGAGAADDLFDLMLMRGTTLADERHCALVVSVAPDQIDAAFAHIAGPGVQLLCDPSAYEIAGAVAVAQLRLAPQVRVASQEREAARLQRMHEEVARLAETLVRIARGDEGDGGVRAPERDFRGEDGGEPIEVAASEVRNLIRSRRLRTQFFGEGLFEDPAWDMLLDLFAAGLEQRRVSVSSLCIAAAVAPTTALRWIAKMDQAGLFQRQADPNDRRRAYISLTPTANAAMRRYIAVARRQGLPLA